MKRIGAWFAPRLDNFDGGDFAALVVFAISAGAGIALDDPALFFGCVWGFLLSINVAGWKSEARKWRSRFEDAQQNQPVIHVHGDPVKAAERVKELARIHDLRYGPRG
ncbi:hypothetical protein [Nocardia sp. NPDC057455]|uniref:hypothetical protein n=1 Tax=Nocardia sp. NPDC057455 TaxID=3346138 RepID=UPI00366B1609